MLVVLRERHLTLFRTSIRRHYVPPNGRNISSFRRIYQQVSTVRVKLTAVWARTVVTLTSFIPKIPFRVFNYGCGKAECESLPPYAFFPASPFPFPPAFTLPSPLVPLVSVVGVTNAVP